MNAYETITLIIDANDGTIEGRTAVQKLVYLCAAQVEGIDISPYRPYFYGPFSRGVASDLGDMSAFAYLNETFSSSFGVYKYDLTQRGKELALKISNQHKYEATQIKNIVKTCKKFCDLKPGPLSFATKAYYTLTNMKNKKVKYTKDDVRKVGKEFDWDIGQEDIDTGIKLLEELNLVQVKEVPA